MTTPMTELIPPEFSRARVLVVGDVMLDRYWSGPTARISPEAPVPVVQVADEEQRPGGAANVALNLAALGVQTRLVGLVGADETGDALRARLTEAGVDCHLQALPDHPTICKLRVLSRHQQLIRLDFETPFNAAERGDLPQACEAALADSDIVVLSDYAKGTLGDAAELIARARKAGKQVIVDPKGRDFGRYHGATLITPNAAEFEAEVGPCPDPETLVSAAQTLAGHHDMEGVLVTRGEHGMSLVPSRGSALHLPAHARDVYDVTGAGDTVVAVLAAAMAAGADTSHASALANLAASLVVTKVGTATVSLAELREAGTGTGGQRGITTPAGLQERLAAARDRGERVVMTNGCFDILHAGHVAYLEQARALGDRLVVAVNDDASVRRLKGAQRPINGLAQRMAVVAGLAAVDWVVPFSDDTPADLVGELLPDVLVKGGDYTPEQVAGAERVRASGGEVVILDFIAGASTSDVIQRIRDA